MMKGYNWSFPTVYVEWLKQIAIFELNLLPLLGIQCVMDMDYRYSVLVAIALPTAVCLLALLGLCVSRCRVSKVEKITAELRRKTLGILFDLSDFDNSGELDMKELQHFVGEVASSILPKAKMKELILRSGGIRSLHDKSEAVIDREAFLRATAEESSDQNRLAFYFPSGMSLRYLQKQQTTSTWISGGAQMLLMFHAPVSMRAFLYFDCTTLGRRHFLRADYSIECYEQEWNAFLPLALILLVAFAIGLPLALGGYMGYHRRALRSPAMRQFLGFIMSRYRPGVEWWEIQEVLRKMVLTGMLIYLPIKSRTAIAVAICITSLVLLNYFRSHTSKMVFWMCQVSYLLTTSKFLVTIFGQTMTEGDGVSEDDRTLGIILVITDVAMYATGIMCCVLITWKAVNQKEKDAPAKKRPPQRPLQPLALRSARGGAIQKKFNLRRSVIAITAEISVGQTEKRADEAARTLHEKILQQRNFTKSRLNMRLQKRTRAVSYFKMTTPTRVAPATRATTGPAAAVAVDLGLARPSGSKTRETAAAKTQRRVALPVRATKKTVAATRMVPGSVASNTGDTTAAKTPTVSPPARASKKHVAATRMVPAGLGKPVGGSKVAPGSVVEKPSPRKPDSLPQGWTRHLEPKSGRYYYVDSRTRKTSWVLPNASVPKKKMKKSPPPQPPAKKKKKKDTGAQKSGPFKMHVAQPASVPKKPVPPRPPPPRPHGIQAGAKPKKSKRKSLGL